MTEATKEPQVKKEIDDLSKVILGKMEVSKDKPGFVTLDKKVFEENLPEDLSLDVVKKSAKYMQDYAIAQSLALGEKSLDIFKEDKKKEIEAVTCFTAMPVGKAVSVIKREQIVPNHLTGEAVPKQYYANCRISIKPAGSQMKAIRNRISELAKQKGL